MRTSESPMRISKAIAIATTSLSSFRGIVTANADDGELRWRRRRFYLCCESDATSFDQSPMRNFKSDCESDSTSTKRRRWKKEKRMVTMKVNEDCNGDDGWS